MSFNHQTFVLRVVEQVSAWLSSDISIRIERKLMQSMDGLKIKQSKTIR
jgi:hypothetical protein